MELGSSCFHPRGDDPRYPSPCPIYLRTPNYKKWPLVVVLIIFFCARCNTKPCIYLINPPPTIRFPSSTLNKCLHHRLSHYPTSHVCTATSPGFRFRGWVQNKVSAHDICCCLLFFIVDTSTSTLPWLPCSLLPIYVIHRLC